MSCALTIDAVRNRTKTVTRRDPDSWKNLKPGDRLTLVEKGMGLKKGEKVVRLAEVEIVDVRVENLLGGLMIDDIACEGIHADYTPKEWARWWAAGHGWRAVLAPIHGMNLDLRYDWFSRPGQYFPLREIQCRRIEWRYLDGGAS